MPRFAANLAYLFPERPLIERFAAAAAAGFRAVELQVPYDVAPSAVKAELDRHGLTMLGINTAPGQAAAGEFGVTAVPGREREFDTLFKQALDLRHRDPRVPDSLPGRQSAAGAAAGRGDDLHQKSDTG